MQAGKEGLARTASARPGRAQPSPAQHSRETGQGGAWARQGGRNCGYAHMQDIRVPSGSFSNLPLAACTYWQRLEFQGVC